MKHKSTVALHVHRLQQQLQEELSGHKEDALRELERLEQLNPYMHSQVAMTTPQNGHTDDSQQATAAVAASREEKAISGDDFGDNCEDRKRRSGEVQKQAEGRLRSLVQFLEAKSAELERIRTSWPSELSLPLGKELEQGGGGRGLADILQDGGGDTGEERRSGPEMDAAVRALTERLEALRRSVDQRLEAEDAARRGGERFLTTLSLQGRRGRPRCKLTRPPLHGATAVTAATSDPGDPSRRSSSLSKERILKKAKQLRAAKEAHPSSEDPSLHSVSSKWRRSLSANGRTDSGSKTAFSSQPRFRDEDQPPSPTRRTSEKPTGSPLAGTEVREPAEEVIIQVQEVTSSVQERGSATTTTAANAKRQPHTSFGDSLTDTSSSFLTSSTVSAVLGDSSLHVSGGSTDDAKRTSDSSLESGSPSGAREASGDEHNSSTEVAATTVAAASNPRRDVLLCRPRVGGSRYIQVGLPDPASRPAWDEGPGEAMVRHGAWRLYHPRPSYSPYSRPAHRWQPGGSRRSSAAAPSVRRVDVECQMAERYCRWYQPPVDRGYSNPAAASVSRRSSRSQHRPVYPLYKDQPCANLFRVELEAHGQGWSTAQEREVGELPPSPPSEQDVGGVTWPLDPPPPGEDTSSSSSSSRDSSLGRGNGGGSVGSSGGSGSSASSSTTTPPLDNGSSEGRSDDDHQDEVDVCPVDLEPTVGDKAVTVQLVTSESVQKHRGPGLVDHRTPMECFKFSREKSLEELADCVNKIMKHKSKGGRLRLWLFDEDEEGTFLPRRLLKGHLIKRSVGSLNRSTVTLLVQALELRDRYYTFDHHKVRFVFVKTPHRDTGEFVVNGHHPVEINKATRECVVRGHHPVDITRATRAIIQVLKKKFMPQCQTGIKLYVESGGKKMHLVRQHSPVSSFEEDVGGHSQHGDILVLLEDFIEQQSSATNTTNAAAAAAALAEASYLGQSHQSGDTPEAPSSATYGSSGESLLTSDDQGDSPLCLSPESPLQIPRALRMFDHGTAGDGAYLALLPPHNGGQDTNGGVAQEEGEREAQELRAKQTTAKQEEKNVSGADASRVHFIIPFNYTSSSSAASDESLSPVSETTPTLSLSPGSLNGVVTLLGKGGHHHHKRKVLQWNLTNNYLSRFSRIKEEEGEGVAVVASSLVANGVGFGGGRIPDRGGPAFERELGEMVEEEEEDDEGASSVAASGHQMESSVEYDSVVSSSTGCFELTTSVEYESLVVSSLEEDLLTRSVHHDSTGSPTGLLASDTAATAGLAAVHTKVVTTIMTDGQTRDVGCRRNGGGADGGDERTPNRELNPVAPVFTPRTRFRMQQLEQQRMAGYSNGNSGARPKGKCSVSGGAAGKSATEKPHSGGRDTGSNSPDTPHSGSNSVFTSDEDLSVYYTPAPAFVYPEAAPRFQSTRIPLTADFNRNPSESHGQLTPGQISAITNCSSSFMAVRLPRMSTAVVGAVGSSVGVDQISEIPDISTSFMEIPAQHQLQDLSLLPGHSTSLSQRHNSSSSFHPDPSFKFASPSLHYRHRRCCILPPLAVFETSHLQASCSALPPLPPQAKSSVRQALARRKPARPARRHGLSGAPPSPLSLPGEEDAAADDADALPMPPDSGAEEEPPQHRSHGAPKSEASAVKWEDPAIMDIGKRVMIAQKSSLNANATEFVPKENKAAAPPPPPAVSAFGLKGVGTEGGVGHGVGHPAPPSPFQPAAPTPPPRSPVAAQFFSCTTVNQQGVNRTVGYQMERTSTTVLPRKPAAYPPLPPPLPSAAGPPQLVNRITSSTLYNVLKRQSGALTAFSPKPPILVSLTNGARTTTAAGLPPKPRPDPTRHVTFAEPPIRNVLKMGGGRGGGEDSYTPGPAPGSTPGPGPGPRPRHSGYCAHDPRRPLLPFVPSCHFSGDSSTNRGAGHRLDDLLLSGRRRIGSGRFDDRPKRYYTGDFRRGAARRGPPFLRAAQQTPDDQVSESGAAAETVEENRVYPPASSKTQGFYYTSEKGGRYLQGYSSVPPPGVARRGPPFALRDDLRGYRHGHISGPPAPRHRTEHGYRISDNVHVQMTRPFAAGGAAHGMGFPPRGGFQERPYRGGHGFQPDSHPHYNPYHQSRAALGPHPHPHPHSRPHHQQGGGDGGGGSRVRERGQSMVRSGGPPPGDFRFRRPIRVQHNQQIGAGGNSSTDQSDISLPVASRAGSARFRRVSRPVLESETETSLGSVTFHSEGSVADSPSLEQQPAGEGEGAAVAAAVTSSSSADTGAESSTTRTSSQGSIGSRQSTRLRRGYIQLGLGNGAYPATRPQ